ADRAVLEHRAGVVGRAADRGHVAEALHLDRRLVVGPRAIAELTGAVHAPAHNGAGLAQRARVLAAGGDLDRVTEIADLAGHRRGGLALPVLAAPARDLAGAVQRAGVVRARGNLGRIVEHCHRDGARMVGHRAVPELRVEVDAPAPDLAVADHRAGVARSQADIDLLRVVETGHHHRVQPGRAGVVAELAIVVVPPARDLARFET